jgi:hypothetical protein
MTAKFRLPTSSDNLQAIQAAPATANADFDDDIPF